MNIKSYYCTYDFVDRDRNIASTRWHVPVLSFSYDAAEAYFIALRGDLEPLSDAVLLKMTISRGYNYAAAGEAGTDSDVARHGVFVIRLADGMYTLLAIPSVKLSLVLNDAGGKRLWLLDPQALEVQGFVSRLPQMTDYAEVQAAALVIAGVAI